MNTLQNRLFVFFMLFVLGGILPLQAAEPVAAETPKQKIEPVPESLSSPRATMETFLHAMNDIKRGKPESITVAVTTLDLSDISALINEEKGISLAWTLLEVMDRTRVVNTNRVPSREKGKAYLFKRYKSGSITISQVDNGRWLFSKESVAKLPEILDEISSKKRVKEDTEVDKYLPWSIRIRQQLPENLKQRTFYLENWHWLALFLMIVVGVILDKLIAFVLRGFVRRWKSKTQHQIYRDVSDNILRPIGLMAMAIVWLLGINTLNLDEQALVILLLAVKFLAGISGVWATYRLVDLITARLQRHAESTESKLDDALVPLIPRTLKIFVTVIGFVFVADNMEVDISSLLAGLGLGGLAFALAAKDMVQNLFGSVTVLMDQTFSVGDWIVVGSVEGSVERIGFRSTRVRTFYGSVITVPNSKFITADVDNMGERRYRRLSCKLSLTYNTPPDRIDAFCEGVRELIRQHPYMRKDYYHVYLNEFAASSLDILLYVFWETPEWNTELRERHRFLADILRLAKALNVEFAYPTQTLYMKQDDVPVDEQLSQQDAMALGQREAVSIVESTTGLGVRPDPVVFPRVK